MEDEQEDMKDVVLEELIRLGVEEGNNGKKPQHSHRFLSGGGNNMGKFNKGRGKGRRSPNSPSLRPHSDRKHTPKSPFASSKRRAEHRRQQQLNKENKKRVFGRCVSEQAGTVVVLEEGLEVTVPEFLVDVCGLIRRSITTEGIFRKAGSSQRQADIKRLIDSGSSLPSSIHVVDAACLLKQYLRCLPDPLLPPDVHTKLARCLALPREEDRLEAVVLCTLLLPRTQRHMLMYLMDFFSDVIDASESNLMDAHNLSIVLAPNLLSSTLSSPTSHRKSTGHDLTHTSPDTTLTTNIEIMQMLLECGDMICRPPSAVCEALQLRLRTRSTEDLLHPNTHSTDHTHLPHTRKKRRSASIQRLMTGLRRVVGHSRGEVSSSSASSPLCAAGSAEDLHTSLRLHPGVTLSPMPDPASTSPATSPRKRKSADAFDLGIEFAREQGGSVIPTLTSSPSSKRAKLDIEVGKSSFSSTASAAVLPASLLPPLCASVSRAKRRSQKLGGSPGGGGGRAITLGRDAIVGHPSPHLPHGPIPTSTQNPPLSMRVEMDERGDGGCSGGRAVRTLSKTRSQITTPVSPAPRLPPKRRSCDVPLGVGVKRANSFEDEARVTRRRSGGRRMTQNEPDGADVCTLGPRGVPDGAECNLRDTAVTTSGLTATIDTLEEQYDNIKQAVRSMEEELEKREVLHLQDTYFSDSANPVSVQNMSCSDMIQSAYERMKVETRDLDASPSENLSRRLGKELKIRSRRSGEHRVIRSPSERRIGNMRRRSRELVQNMSGNQITAEDKSASFQQTSAPPQHTNATLHHTPASPQNTSVPPQHTGALPYHTPASSHHTPGPSRHTPGTQHTPRLKPVLMNTPITTSLRRGKPNSVKTGLPLVVRVSGNTMTDSPTQLDDSCRHVLVSKRSDHTHISEQQPRAKCVRRFLQETSRKEISTECSKEDDLLNKPSGCIDLSGMSCSDDVSMSGSFLEQLPGPLTRRRSSLLSLSSRLPLLSLSPASCTAQKKSPVGIVVIPHEAQPVEERENLHDIEPTTVENNHNFSGEGSEENWLPASDFTEYLEDCEAGTSSENMGRPSLAALMKQRKVKANVQLFNNLQCTTPQRRQTRARCGTPQNLPIHGRPGSAEQRRATPRRTQSISVAHHRTTLTPRELLRARQKSFRVRPSHKIDPKVAVVSPLRESTVANIQQERSTRTSRPFHGNASSPHAPPTPVKQSPALTLPAKSVLANSSFLVSSEHSSSSCNPPKLPPRGITAPSPVRIQYR